MIKMIVRILATMIKLVPMIMIEIIISTVIMSQTRLIMFECFQLFTPGCLVLKQFINYSI